MHAQSWPAFDREGARESTVTVVVQVDGKMRDRIELPSGAGEAAMKTAALRSGKVGLAIAGRAVDRLIVVPDRLINIVTKR